MGIDPVHFLDHISPDEVVEIFRARNDQEKLLWERSRYIGFFAAGQKLTYSEFSRKFPFSWEREGEAVQPGIHSHQEALERMEEINLKSQKNKK